MSDRRQGSAARGYGYRWQKARKNFLSQHPLCRMCEREGRVTAATVVDHIEPHRGDPVKFWDENNWMSICKMHHDSHKQRQEKSGRLPGTDVNGFPIDPKHSWNE